MPCHSQPQTYVNYSSRMIGRVFFVVVSVFAVTCHAAEKRVLPGTSSPDKRTAIMEKSDDEGRDYYFVAQPSGKRLGDVLPPAQRGQVSNVSIITSWNRDSSKVALLVFYGTKLNELLLYSKDKAGQFQHVTLRKPEPEAIYQAQAHRALPQPGDGYNENAVGPWLDDNTVLLIAGEAKQTTQPEDQYDHWLVTFKAHVQSTHATVSDLQLKGPLSNEADAKFTKQWGERYFTESSEAKDTR